METWVPGQARSEVLEPMPEAGPMHPDCVASGIDQPSHTALPSREMSHFFKCPPLNGVVVKEGDKIAHFVSYFVQDLVFHMWHSSDIF